MAQARQALADRLFQAGLYSVELMNVYLGDALDLYRTLYRMGPGTPAELAEKSGINERYAREWLESQPVSGILEVVTDDAPAGTRRFSISDAHAEVLTDLDSPLSRAPLAKYIGAFGPILPKLKAAFRDGGGVAWEDYGPEVAEAQGDFNRPWIKAALATEYLPLIADVHDRLRGGALVADVGCGVGWAGIAIAQAYPDVAVDGFDRDTYSIELARRNASEAGVADRVQHEVRDLTKQADDGRYHLVICIEAVHDLPRPAEFLAGIRRLLAPGGVAVVADPRANGFVAPSHEVDRLLYAASVLCCLPVGLAEQPSAGTGTMIEATTMQRFGKEAGFSQVAVLDQIDNPLTRFFRMDP